MKVKTSISIEKRIWQQLKRVSVENDREVGELLENAISEEYLLKVDSAIAKHASSKHIELDFDSVPILL